MTTSTTRIYPQEWRDEHANNRYPFADRATLVANTGEFLPDTVFLDAALHIPGAAGRLRISRIEVRAGLVTVTVGDEQMPQRASGSFDPLATDGNVVLIDTYGRAVGTLVSTSDLLQTFQAWSEGVRTFTVDATEFAASCCFSVPEIGFRGFLLDDGSLFTGDIFLVGENGVTLSTETYFLSIVDGANVSQQPFEAIRIDVTGDALFRRKSCDNAETFPIPRFVRKIIVKHDCQTIEVLPGPDGDFKIHSGRRYVEDPAIRLQVSDGGLLVELLGTPKNAAVS